MCARASSQILNRGSGCENGGENNGDNGGEITGVLFPCLDKYSRTVQGLSDPILLTTQTYSSSCLLPLNVTAGDAFSYNSFIGQEPNQVFAMGLCIPGSETKDCFDCITEGVTELIQSCPNQTEAYSLPGRHQHTLHGSLGKPSLENHAEYRESEYNQSNHCNLGL
ncbi:hypothetical protein F2Q70_00034920 [Brassica cretica]|uniref:Gnk2-homologous domain-containing protein n=1 Tax=Brassica cretica TaxID=69181 RepID=A0A8S9JYD8_BRACR|nr:hypothetical protein F2Q70_00034920 [Brassica cretica]